MWAFELDTVLTKNVRYLRRRVVPSCPSLGNGLEATVEIPTASLAAAKEWDSRRILNQAGNRKLGRTI
jgi:hypothetical protein